MENGLSYEEIKSFIEKSKRGGNSAKDIETLLKMCVNVGLASKDDVEKALAEASFGIDFK